MKPITIVSQCDLDLRDYPFDKQECSIHLGLKDYKFNEALFIGKENASALVIGPLAKNNQYIVSKVTSQNKMYNITFFEDHAFSTIRLTVNLQRRPSNYYYFFILPHVLSILFCLFMFDFQIYTGLRAFFAIISILLDLKVIYIINSQIGLKAYDTPILIKHVGFNLTMIGLLLILSILIRKNISFIHSKVEHMKSIENNFIFKLFLVNSSNSIESDLIQMIQNDQYTKIVQLNRSTLNKFSLLIQLTDRLLILSYSFLILFTFFFVF